MKKILIALIVISSFYILSKWLFGVGTDKEFVGEYCQYPVKMGVGKNKWWEYSRIELNQDSSCHISYYSAIPIQSYAYGPSSSFDGRWTRVSENECKVFGVSEEKYNYNGIYVLDNDKLQPPASSLQETYERDLVPKNPFD